MSTNQMPCVDAHKHQRAWHDTRLGDRRGGTGQRGGEASAPASKDWRVMGDDG
jgi:hypothetical protein